MPSVPPCDIMSRAMNEQNLYQLVEHLEQTLGDRLDAVVLFGSRARGEARTDSDWDLLIVVEGLPRSPLKRWRWWVSVVPLEKREGISPLLRTPEEWYARVTPLTAEIAYDGRVLYDAAGRMRRYLTRVRDALASLGLERQNVDNMPIWVWRQGVFPQNWEKRLQEMVQ